MSETELTPDASIYDDVEGLFDDKPRGGGTYLSIFQHQICQRSKSHSKIEDAEVTLLALQANEQGWTGPHKTTNPKNKQDVWSASKPYNRMIGRIADISKHTKEFDASKGGGKVTNWDIVFLSGGKRLTLQLTWCDHTLKRFLKVAPNIDFERPILISAFKSMKDGEAKQAVSFRQYKGPMSDIAAFKDVDKWEKVDEYWKPDKTDDKGLALEGSKRIGPDGSELPPPVEDLEDNSWDYRAQNNFLAIHFRDKTLPIIKALAEKYGLNSQDTDTSQATHTGPAVNNEPVTTKPFDPTFSTMSEAATGAHVNRVKQLATACGFDPDFAVQKLMGVDLNELNDEAARYAIYKLEERVKKTGATVPPAPVAPPPPPPPVTQPVDDDDLWDTEELEKQPAPQKAQPPDESDEW